MTGRSDLGTRTKTRHSYIYIYMLPIASQTAGPIGLKFSKKNLIFFISRATPGPSASL